MCNRPTSGTTQRGERPVMARSDDVLSTRQHFTMGHDTQEEGGISVREGTEVLGYKVAAWRTVTSLVASTRSLHVGPGLYWDG